MYPTFERAGHIGLVNKQMATSGESTTSSEAEALKNSFGYLVKSIEYQREECSCESDQYKKAVKFLGHLLRAVNGDSSKYHVFILVLFDCDQPSIARHIRGQ